MAAKLKIKFTGRKRSFFDSLRARIVLADDLGAGEDDKRLLSSECACASELKAEADSLKSQLDRIVRIAQKKFAVKPGKKC
jgi:hypothetical protein